MDASELTQTAYFQDMAIKNSVLEDSIKIPREDYFLREQPVKGNDVFYHFDLYDSIKLILFWEIGYQDNVLDLHVHSLCLTANIFNNKLWFNFKILELME